MAATGLEELKDRLSQVQDPNARALSEAIYDTVAAQHDPARSLERNLRAAVQAVAEAQSQRPQVPFGWMRVGTKGSQAFIAFEAGQIPITIWFDRGQVRDVTLQQEATQQLSYTALLGGQVGPKEFSEEFKQHHPDEPTDFAITYTTGQILDQLLRGNGRVTLVLTSKPGKPEDNKKEVAERFARGWVGRYDGNDPMTFLWMVPERADIYFDEPSDPGPKFRKRLADAGMTIKGMFATPEQVGEAVAEEILKEWQEKDTANQQYVFGLVTGSTPKPFLAALMPRLRALPPAVRAGLLQRLQIVVPDDHVDKDAAGHYQNITRVHPVSAYTTRENDFVRPANEGLPSGLPGMSINQVVVPEVGKVDTQLQALPGIDRYFITFGPQHVFMQFAGEADDVKLYDPQELIHGKRVVVIQNSAEPAGVFGQIPASLRLPVHVIRADDPKKGRLIPSDPADWDWENVAALIVMGGPPNVHENSTYPWLDDLTGLLRYTAERQVPTLGVCLGCQLLAHAVGGEVTQEEVRGYDQHGKPIKNLLTPNAPRGIEKGFVPVSVTPAGQAHPFLSGFRSRFNVAELHGDTIYFPQGATFQLADGTIAPVRLLLQGEQVPWQAFAIGDRVIGVLGHPEASPEIFDEWLQVPDNEEDETAIRRMGRLFEKNEAYQKRQGLVAQNWWKIVEESWQQRSSAGLEEDPVLKYQKKLAAQIQRDGIFAVKLDGDGQVKEFWAGGVPFSPGSGENLWLLHYDPSEKVVVLLNNSGAIQQVQIDPSRGFRHRVVAPSYIQPLVWELFRLLKAVAKTGVDHVNFYFEGEPEGESI
ncbi:MAG: gamma-glutamyl-gamma-aminobutyrate hydrolase family protein [Elusimicrobia bacterium]|nr:gamma-glutamyl-gamma-aminobutyrate hydrolase family protein [Elusimicrobiota bacterium]